MKDEISDLTNMCRLCSSDDKLVWVFDRRLENLDSMQYLISLATGVQVYTTDAVSQKICEKCCNTIVDIYAFRRKSLENDKQLWEQLKIMKTENGNAILPNDIQIKEEKPDSFVEPKQEVVEGSLNIHPTIRELYSIHPQLKLPNVCLKMNVKPTVLMKMDQVEDYFKQRQLNFEEQCKLALKSRQTARKKTLSLNSPRQSGYLESPPCPIKGQIIPSQETEEPNGVLRPIKIKIIPKLPAGEDATDFAKELGTDKTVQCQEKTILSDMGISPIKKTNINQYVESHKNNGNHLSRVVDQRTLHTCSICNFMHYSSSKLKRHRNKHLRCQFCRTIFQTVKGKKEHLETCMTKKAINNFPCLELPKIETDEEVVNKYRNAFGDYFTSIGNQPNLDVLKIDKSSDNSTTYDPDVIFIKSETPDIIEILSDDDNVLEEPAPVKIPKVEPLTPHITIKNNPIVDSIDFNASGLTVLRNLLIHCKPRSMSTDKNVQTEGPSAPIEVDENELTAIFKDIKPHMHVFRVPVEIFNGPFNVKYKTSERTDKTKSKNLHLWNHLTPVDINTNKINISTTSTEETQIDSMKDRVSTELQLNEGVSKNNSSSSLETIKPANSTHSRIFVVGPSAASTFPTGRTRTSPSVSSTDKEITNSKRSKNASSIHNNDSDAYSKRMKVSPRPQSVNKQKLYFSPPDKSSMCNNIVDSTLKRFMFCPPPQTANKLNINSSNPLSTCNNVSDSTSKESAPLHENVHKVSSTTSQQFIASEIEESTLKRLTPTSSSHSTHNAITHSVQHRLTTSPGLNRDKKKTISMSSLSSKDVTNFMPNELLKTSPKLQTTEEAVSILSSSKPLICIDVPDSVQSKLKISSSLHTTMQISSMPSLDHSLNNNECDSVENALEASLHTVKKEDISSPQVTSNVADRVQNTPQSLHTAKKENVSSSLASNNVADSVQNKLSAPPSLHVVKENVSSSSSDYTLLSNNVTHSIRNIKNELNIPCLHTVKVDTSSPSSDYSLVCSNVTDSIRELGNSPSPHTAIQNVVAASSPDNTLYNNVTDCVQNGQKTNSPPQTTKVVQSLPDLEFLLTNNVTSFIQNNLRSPNPLPEASEQVVPETNSDDAAPKRIIFSPPPVSASSITTPIQEKSLSYSEIEAILQTSNSESLDMIASCIDRLSSSFMIDTSSLLSNNCEIAVPPLSDKSDNFKIPSDSQPTSSISESISSSSDLPNKSHLEDPKRIPTDASFTPRSALNQETSTCSPVNNGPTNSNSYTTNSQWHATRDEPTPYSVGYSNVPVHVINNNVPPTYTAPRINRPNNTSARRSSFPNTHHPYRSKAPAHVQTIPRLLDVKTSYRPTTPKVPDYYTRKLNNRRNSVPDQYICERATPLPHYPEELHFVHSRKRAGGGNYFINSNVHNTGSSAIHQNRCQSAYSIPSQMHLNNNYYPPDMSNSPVPGDFNSLQRYPYSSQKRCPSAYSTSQMNDNYHHSRVVNPPNVIYSSEMSAPPTRFSSCSAGGMASGRFGQIRVKNMRELI